ncbi:MAG: DUF4350 domain-containing protein [bacterium]|nr:DUF4350 domain-containing protein [bacterium]
MRKWHLWIAILIVFAATFTIVVSGGSSAAGPSTLSRGRSGWKGVALWFEAQGRRVQIVDRSFDDVFENQLPSVLVVSFPAAGWYEQKELEAVTEMLRDGACVVYASSNGHPSPAEMQFAEHLGFSTRRAEVNPPLLPWEWYRWAQQVEQLSPVQPWPGEVVTVPNSEWRMVAPDNATVLYNWSDGTPAAWLNQYGNGTVVVVPSAAFSNPFLGDTGNADLLQSLAQTYPGPWFFDELRHGVIHPSAISSSQDSWAIDGLLLHLLVLYGVVILALARRFGPAWQPNRSTGSSTASFLLSMARLHRRLGHHQEAAQLLIARSSQIDPNLETPAIDHPVSNDAALVELSQRLSKERS